VMHHNFCGATSKVDFEHTFLTYSQKSGARVDNIRRLWPEKKARGLK